MDNLAPTSTNRYLVIILHGYASKVTSCSHIKKIVDQRLPKGSLSRILPLRISTFSKTDPDDTVAWIIKNIDEYWSGGQYDKLILIGHSCGALLVRQVYVYACGENADAPFKSKGFETPREWAKHVNRIILLAGMNRGWSINMHASLWHAFVVEIGCILGNLLALFGHKVFIFKMRRGAPFITQLRIQWLSMLKKKTLKGVGNAIVVQLLGTIDDLVSPDDNIDLVTGSNFYYLEVPMSSHSTVLNMEQSNRTNDEILSAKVNRNKKDISELALSTPQVQRGEVFENALLYSAAQLEEMQVDTFEQKSPMQNPDVKNVVFVVHGIRDAGYWTKKVAGRVQRLGKENSIIFETETSSYGYFPMLPFLVYKERRKKVEWLMDQYTENMALYPEADFSFIGHSNGTYLLAKALEEYPACHFKNVVFAGSVVRQKYDWMLMITQGRIKGIINLVATADWVVAIFPKTFQTLRLQDLGSGGHDGFSNLDSKAQVRFIKGGHGAGVEEKMWDMMARFIVLGPTSTPNDNNYSGKQNSFVKILGYTAPLIFALAIFILLLIGMLIWHSLTCYPGLQSAALILYIVVIWKIITKL